MHLCLDIYIYTYIYTRTYCIPYIGIHARAPRPPTTRPHPPAPAPPPPAPHPPHTPAHTCISKCMPMYIPRLNFELSIYAYYVTCVHVYTHAHANSMVVMPKALSSESDQAGCHQANSEARESEHGNAPPPDIKPLLGGPG